MVSPQPQFLCTSYVHDYPQGPLSIISIEENALRIVGVLYNTEGIRVQLAEGESLDEVIASLKSYQHTSVSIPLSDLVKIVWNDFSSDVVFTYQVDGKCKRATASIANALDRDRLLLSVRDALCRPVDCFDEPASVLAVAWTRLLGAAMAVAGTILVVLLWDPVRIGRVRGGAIFLLLGRTGCVVVGIGIFIACCISAWLAIRKQSRYYTCEFGEAGPV